MALQLIEVSNDGGKPFVILTSTLPQHNLAILELQSAAARQDAIKYATAKGIANARCEMPSAPYAVDAAGQPVTNPQQQKVASYRVDVPICQGL